jgi:hypothetical protein
MRFVSRWDQYIRECLSNILFQNSNPGETSSEIPGVDGLLIEKTMISRFLPWIHGFLWFLLEMFVGVSGGVLLEQCELNQGLELEHPRCESSTD